MPKRFCDTERWRSKRWRELTPECKLFWQYVNDNCNHGGVWEVDFGLASYQIGQPLEESVLRATFADSITELDNGQRWFLNDFIEEQYGTLNRINHAHNGAAKILEKHGLLEFVTNRNRNGRKFEASEAEDRSLLAHKDKDKDKMLVKDKDPVPSSISVSRKPGTMLDDIRRQDEELKQTRKLELVKKTFNLEQA